MAAEYNNETVFAALEPTCGVPYWASVFPFVEVKKFETTDDAFDFLKKYGDRLVKNPSIENIRVMDREPRVVSGIFDKEAFLKNE